MDKYMPLAQKHRPESQLRAATNHYPKTLSRRSNHRTRRQHLCQNVYNKIRNNFDNYLKVRIRVDRLESASECFLFRNFPNTSTLRFSLLSPCLDKSPPQIDWLEGENQNPTGMVVGNGRNRKRRPGQKIKQSGPPIVFFRLDSAAATGRGRTAR